VARALAGTDDKPIKIKVVVEPEPPTPPKPPAPPVPPKVPAKP
jgi:hypothetical protein